MIKKTMSVIIFNCILLFGLYLYLPNEYKKKEEYINPPPSKTYIKPKLPCPKKTLDCPRECDEKLLWKPTEEHITLGSYFLGFGFILIIIYFLKETGRK